MRPLSIRRFFSWLLLGAGVFLLLLGTRELFYSYFGQREAARSFESESPVPDNLPAEADGEHPSYARKNSGAMPQPGDTVAKLVIPRLDAQLYVVEGTGKGELRRGPGHMAGSALPGEDGNCIIAGHRDTHFRVLKDVRRGDDILLETTHGEYVYRVKSTTVISPDNLAPLRNTSDSRLNLITCYPFHYVGSAPRRYVVEAELSGILPAGARPPS